MAHVAENVRGSMQRSDTVSLCLSSPESGAPDASFLNEGLRADGIDSSNREETKCDVIGSSAVLES